MQVIEWLPSALVGAWFLGFGILKLYGLAAGIEGGARAPFSRRLCGT